MPKKVNKLSKSSQQKNPATTTSETKHNLVKSMPKVKTLVAVGIASNGPSADKRTNKQRGVKRSDLHCRQTVIVNPIARILQQYKSDLKCNCPVLLEDGNSKLPEYLFMRLGVSDDWVRRDVAASQISTEFVGLDVTEPSLCAWGNESVCISRILSNAPLPWIGEEKPINYEMKKKRCFWKNALRAGHFLNLPLSAGSEQHIEYYRNQKLKQSLSAHEMGNHSTLSGFAESVLMEIKGIKPTDCNETSIHMSESLSLPTTLTSSSTSTNPQSQLYIVSPKQMEQLKSISRSSPRFVSIKPTKTRVRGSLSDGTMSISVPSGPFEVSAQSCPPFAIRAGGPCRTPRHSSIKSSLDSFANLSRSSSNDQESNKSKSKSSKTSSISSDEQNCEKLQKNSPKDFYCLLKPSKIQFGVKDSPPVPAHSIKHNQIDKFNSSAETTATATTATTTNSAQQRQQNEPSENINEE